MSSVGKSKVTVESGCRDCKKCTNSSVANLGRNTGRATAALMTGGLSEAGFLFTKKCRGCGHPLSLHQGAEARTVQPAVQVQPVPAPRTPAPTVPSGPPAGWYDDPDGGTAQRWWDGTRWTEHRTARQPG